MEIATLYGNATIADDAASYARLLDAAASMIDLIQELVQSSLEQSETTNEPSDLQVA